MTAAPLLLGSITDVRPDHAGAVALTGSHGGLYPAVVASRANLRAAIFNDAGGGLEGAGVAGVLRLADAGFAAAAADCMSARIGDAEDMLAHGRISVVNSVAAALGLQQGQDVAEALERLVAAPAPTALLDPVAEARRSVTLPKGLTVSLLDSASMVGPADTGTVVVTGSHGGLIGGDPARALKAAARLAVFNDAGGGKDGVGFGRLPALETRGIAALTVAHDSARIGDAGSAMDTGVISAANAPARALGAAPGQPLRAFLDALPPV